MTARPSIETEKAIGGFLSAAVGDALGWPFEGRARRARFDGRTGIATQSSEFQGWVRAGSRSAPFREPIAAGNYSDDTQLLLSTARSILHGRDWWEHFAFIELPFWDAYERGGGGATKRAAQSWQTGRAPWESDQSKERYFEAGGNGVAMRILPHVIASGGSQDARDLSAEIILNGICTHGHPRALVGALLHGFTLWLSFRQEEMLEFGALTRAVSQGFPEWAELPEIPSGWQGALSKTGFEDYRRLWEETIRESMALIDVAVNGLRLGPLSAGPETLHRMGALSPKTNGSGTITAAAALFLASRYAATPLQGIVLGSTVAGADTDTLASMCGSILGAVHGYEWLGNFATSVQDADYIRNISEGLIHGRSESVKSLSPRVTKQSINDFRSQLASLNEGEEMRLPDGRRASLSRITSMFSESSKAELCMFQVDDGQSLAFKRVVRRQKTLSTQSEAPVDVQRVGIKIFVSDLAKAKDFYVNKLRFPMVKEYSSGFTVADVISVLLLDNDDQRTMSFDTMSLPAPMPCIRVTNIDSVIHRLAASGIAATPASEHRSTKAFRVLDPFGNRLEFFEGR